MSKDILEQVIDPALEEAAERGIPPGSSARALLYAIGLQESNLLHRFQLVTGAYPRGPARGLWQFEEGGGVRGVMAHAATATHAAHFARKYVGVTTHAAVWAALAYEDVFACLFARLLLWSDPAPLPAPEPRNEGTAWAYYLRLWRPGKSIAASWPGHWQRALDDAA